MEVYGLFKSHRMLQEAFARLKAAGVGEDSVSLIGPGEEISIHKLVPTKVELAQQVGVAKAATAAGAAGGLAGLAAGAAALPAGAALLASGPILMALPVALWGAAMGGFIAYAVGRGVALPRAETYAARVQEGETLLICHSVTLERARTISQQLVDAGAEEVFRTEDESGSNLEK